MANARRRPAGRAAAPAAPSAGAARGRLRVRGEVGRHRQLRRIRRVAGDRADGPRTATRATWRGLTRRRRARALHATSSPRRCRARRADDGAARGLGAADRRPTSSTGCSRSTSTTYLPGDLIAKVDIATMAYALEARSPLLDHELMRVRRRRCRPTSSCAAGRRSGSCARRCAAGCPTRSSTGPSRASRSRSSDWFRGELADMVARRAARPGARSTAATSAPARSQRLLDRHAAGTDDDAKRIWSLLVLELWHREFVDAVADPGWPRRVTRLTDSSERHGLPDARILVISPVRNEAAHIERVVRAVAAQELTAGEVDRDRRPLDRRHARDAAPARARGPVHDGAVEAATEAPARAVTGSPGRPRRATSTPAWRKADWRDYTT